MDIVKVLSDELGIKKNKLRKTISLIDEGNTIPFIARYRKEVTGSLDDTVLRTLSERLNYLRGFDKRREEITSLIDGQGKLTPEITAALDKAKHLQNLKTSIVRTNSTERQEHPRHGKKGLEPLAALLLEQKENYGKTIEEIAKEYIDEEKEVNSAEDALAGARDIIAEDISDSADYRREIRAITWRAGSITTKQIKEGSSPYENYYDYTEKLSSIPNHRILAVNRAEKRRIHTSFGYC